MCRWEKKSVLFVKRSFKCVNYRLCQTKRFKCPFKSWWFWNCKNPEKEGTTDDKQSKFLFIKCLRDICIRSQRCNFVIVQVCLSTCHPSRDELWQAHSITFNRQTNCERFTSQGGSEVSLWHILDTMHCYWYIKEIAHSWCLIQNIYTYYQNILSFCFQIHFSDFFLYSVVLRCSWAWKKRLQMSD